MEDEHSDRHAYMHYDGSTVTACEVVDNMNTKIYLADRRHLVVPNRELSWDNVYDHVVDLGEDYVDPWS